MTFDDVLDLAGGDIAEVFEDDDLAELLDTGSITKEIGGKKIVIALTFTEGTLSW